MATRPRLTTTHTYATCNIVVCQRTDSELSPIVYVEDFSYETKALLPTGVTKRLDPRHVRIFPDLKSFSEWLHEESAIVDKGWAI